MEGSYSISINDSETMFTGEGGFFVAPSQAIQRILHLQNENSKRFRARWIFFKARVNGEHELDEIMDFPIVITDENAKLMNYLFEEIFESNDVFDEMSAAYKMLKLLISLSTPKSPISNHTLLAALEYIHENYKKKINVSDLAQITHTSESYLYSVFKSNLGTSPVAYLTHYRLTIASDMIRQSELSIKEIAEAVGFDDQFYFSKVFKKRFNVSPRKYRSIV
jgi:AraC-like DNA-binding protein